MNNLFHKNLIFVDLDIFECEYLEIINNIKLLFFQILNSKINFIIL